MLDQSTGMRVVGGGMGANLNSLPASTPTVTPRGGFTATTNFPNLIPKQEMIEDFDSAAGNADCGPVPVAGPTFLPFEIATTTHMS